MDLPVQHELNYFRLIRESGKDFGDYTLTYN